MQAVKVEHGLKLDVRESILKKLQEDPYIQEHFKLNVRRLNRWWFSVYFDKLPVSNT